MKYSVRVHGGTHDTIWDKVTIEESGWLTCVRFREPTEAEKDENEQDGGGRNFHVIEDERYYPPQSIYSVKPLR